MAGRFHSLPFTVAATRSEKQQRGPFRAKKATITKAASKIKQHSCAAIIESRFRGKQRRF